MGSPLLASVVSGAGLVVALLGLLVGVLMSRRRRPMQPGNAGRIDPWFTLMVAGLVVVILGAGDWVMLALTA